MDKLEILSDSKGMMNVNPMLRQVENILNSYENNLISSKRKAVLDQLVLGIAEEMDSSGTADVMIICTHNSRRSVLAQLWLNLLAQHLGLSLRAWSGGTEATAMNHRIATALEESGFELIQKTTGENPRYQLGENSAPHERYYSKIYSDASNPQTNFIAVLVCGSAYESCPIIMGAQSKFYVPYLDPKLADGTKEESQVYLKKIVEIGREMGYVCVRLQEYLRDQPAESQDKE